MQLGFQAIPINLNAQVDRNNKQLHKFKIDRTCSGACLPERSQPWALPNFGSGLVQLQLDGLELHAAHSRTPAPARTYRQRE